MDGNEHARDDSLRRARRQAIRLEGTIQGRDESIDVEVLDLSHGGCLIRGAASLDRDRVVDVSLRLGPTPVHAKARVVDSSLDGEKGSELGGTFLVGLEFLTLSDQDADRLRRFVDSLSKGPGEP